jgi:hypothetical protein
MPLWIDPVRDPPKLDIRGLTGIFNDLPVALYADAMTPLLEWAADRPKSWHNIGNPARNR